MDTLPESVVLTIGAYSGPAVIQASAVCRAWRRALLSSPQPWQLAWDSICPEPSSVEAPLLLPSRLRALLQLAHMCKQSVLLATDAQLDTLCTLLPVTGHAGLVALHQVAQRLPPSATRSIRACVHLAHLCAGTAAAIETGTVLQACSADADASTADATAASISTRLEDGFLALARAGHDVNQISVRDAVQLLGYRMRAAACTALQQRCGVTGLEEDAATPAILGPQWDASLTRLRAAMVVDAFRRGLHMPDEAEPPTATQVQDALRLLYSPHTPFIAPAASSHCVAALQAAMNSAAQSVAVLNAVSDVFTREAGLRGDSDTYSDVRNSLLGSVLVRRKGLPIALSILFMRACEVAGVPGMYAAGAPGHFVVGFSRPRMHTVLIDPFNDCMVQEPFADISWSPDMPAHTHRPFFSADTDVLHRAWNNVGNDDKFHFIAVMNIAETMGATAAQLAQLAQAWDGLVAVLRMHMTVNSSLRATLLTFMLGRTSECSKRMRTPGPSSSTVTSIPQRTGASSSTALGPTLTTASGSTASATSASTSVRVYCESLLSRDSSMSVEGVIAGMQHWQHVDDLVVPDYSLLRMTPPALHLWQQVLRSAADG